MSWSARSLVTRVALSTALAVILASACVALLSSLLARRMASTREDTTLQDAAETLALELRTPGADPRWVADDETRELAHTSIRLAVFAGGVFLAGDRALSSLPAGNCSDVGTARVCSRQAGPWLAVVARDQSAQREQQQQLTYASALAVLLTSGLGALVAFSVARVVTAPLARLKRAVESVPGDDPGAAELGEAVGLSEIDGLRESLRSLFARLSLALTQSRRFAGDAAHELRTPLASLLGELELTAERASADDRAGLARARRVAERMSSLIDRLLILARLEPLQELESLELRELVEEAIDALPMAVQRRIGLESPHDCDAACVRGDRTLLVASLSNALDNALKFSDQTVRVILARRADRLTVSVLDRGPGLDADERERVFAAFYRSPSSRASDVPGHGIGLALIAHVMSLHGGDARFVDSACGAQLELSLPTGEAAAH